MRFSSFVFTALPFLNFLLPWTSVEYKSIYGIMAFAFATYNLNYLLFFYLVIFFILHFQLYKYNISLIYTFFFLLNRAFYRYYTTSSLIREMWSGQFYFVLDKKMILMNFSVWLARWWEDLPLKYRDNKRGDDVMLMLCIIMKHL